MAHPPSPPPVAAQSPTARRAQRRRCADRGGGPHGGPDRPRARGRRGRSGPRDGPRGPLRQPVRRHPAARRERQRHPGGDPRPPPLRHQTGAQRRPVGPLRRPVVRLRRAHRAAPDGRVTLGGPRPHRCPCGLRLPVRLVGLRGQGPAGRARPAREGQAGQGVLRRRQARRLPRHPPGHARTARRQARRQARHRGLPGRRDLQGGRPVVLGHDHPPGGRRHHPPQPIQWQNRPTYQQVVEFPTHR